MDGEKTLKKKLKVEGTHATEVGGSLTVDGATTLNNTLTVVGNKATGLGGALTVDGETTLKKKLKVEGTHAMELGGSLTVDGATTLKGNLIVQGDLDLDGGNLARIHAVSGARDANNDTVPVKLADVGTLKGTTDRHGNTSAVKVAGDLDLDGGNLAGVHTVLGANDDNNDTIFVTLADVGTLKGTTDRHGNTSAVKVVGRLTVTGNITGNLSGTATTADHATAATTATNAGHATTAATATTAGHATTATNADHATTAAKATNADHATTAATATNADDATTATNADHATTAATATNADHATTATTATHADHATTATTATDADNATRATNADHATLATTATTVAHSLEIKVDGQQKATYDGSASATVDITTSNNTVPDPLSVTTLRVNQIQPNNANGMSFVGFSVVAFPNATVSSKNREALEGRFDTEVFGQTVAYHTLRHDSDQTLKENILPIEHGILNKLLGVGVYTFTFTEEAQQKYGYGRETHIGFFNRANTTYLPMLVGVHSVGGDTDVYHIESHYWPPVLFGPLKEVHAEFSGKINGSGGNSPFSLCTPKYQ